jgi:hypothetical protein
MERSIVKSNTAALRIAVAVGVGVVAHTLNPSTGDVAQAYAQVATQGGAPGECASGFCGTPDNNGGGSGSGSGSSILMAFISWLGF